MEDFPTFFLEHYLISLVSAIALLVFISNDCLDSKRTMAHFTRATLCILVLIFSESIEVYYSNLSVPTFMRVLLSVIAYNARPAIAYFLCMSPAEKQMPRLARILFIPLIINLILTLTAFFSPLYFSYNGNNSFSRGPLGYSAFVVSIFYALVLMIFCFLRMRKGEKRDAIICSFGILACALSVYVEVEFDYKGALVSILLWGEVFYYAYLLVARFSTDYLTGAYVRSHLYREVESRKSCSRYYIMFDVNGLKRINDQYGHAEGDLALTTFSKTCFQLLPGKALFYRTGGDEFSILYRTAKEEDVLALINQITGQCACLHYGISYGYSHFVKPEEFESASGRADAMLYTNKRAFWKEYVKNHPEEAAENPPRALS